jgi:hypothetical protein
VVEAAAKAGYETAGTLPRRLVGTGPLAWPRVGVYHADGDRRFRAKVSPGMRRLRSSPAWEAIDRVRRVIGARRA